MPIKTKEELFGDDGVNGPKSPIDYNAAPGMGVKNRAVKYGEMLTSYIINRLGWALALNDEDLHGRLVLFEEGGLDAMYRLGSANIAGGGRIITIDGGALEMRPDPSAPTGDRANALYRAATDAAGSDGLVGYDFVARAGGVTDPAAGSALFGFLDRRLVVLDSSYTALEAQMEGTISGSRLTITTPDCHWALPPNAASTYTDLMVGHDLVEVMTSAYAGTYLLQSIGRFGSSEPAYAELQTFAGTMLNTPPNTEVIFRVFRPQFATGTKARPGALGSGVVITALPSEGSSGATAAALTLVPGQRGPELQADEGVGYALAVKVLADTGGFGWLDEVGITALGTFHARNPQVNLGGGMPSSFARALAGFRYVNEQPDGNVLGFLAHHKTGGTRPFVGLAVQERRVGGLPGTYASDKIVLVPALDSEANRDWSLAQGSLVEVWAAGAEVGVFRVQGSESSTWSLQVSPKDLLLEHLSGTAATFPASGACEVFPLEGVILGTYAQSVQGTARTRRVAASIVGTLDAAIGEERTTDEDHVVLQLTAQSRAEHSYLVRGVRADSDGYEAAGTEAFTISRTGDAWFDGDLTATALAGSTVTAATVTADDVKANYTYGFTYEKTRTITVPLGFFRPDRADSAWSRNNLTGRLELASAYGNNDVCSCPLSGLLPSTAKVTQMKVSYFGESAASVNFQFSRQDASVGRTMIVGTSMPAGSSPRTVVPGAPISMDLQSTEPIEIGLRTLGVVAADGAVRIFSVEVTYTYQAFGE